MSAIIHTAEIRIGRDERIITASYRKMEVMEAASKWRREYPGRRIKYKTIIEKGR